MPKMPTRNAMNVPIFRRPVPSSSTLFTSGDPEVVKSSIRTTVQGLIQSCTAPCKAVLLHDEVYQKNIQSRQDLQIQRHFRSNDI